MVAGFLAGCGCVSADLETGAGSGAGRPGGGALAAVSGIGRLGGGALAAGRTDESAVFDYGYALMLGTVAGGATAFSDGLARREDILRLLGQLAKTPGSLYDGSKDG